MQLVVDHKLFFSKRLFLAAHNAQEKLSQHVEICLTTAIGQNFLDVIVVKGGIQLLVSKYLTHDLEETSDHKVILELQGSDSYSL
jgi:hypothetical protein